MNLKEGFSEDANGGFGPWNVFVEILEPFP